MGSGLKYKLTAETIGDFISPLCSSLANVEKCTQKETSESFVTKYC